MAQAFTGKIRLGRINLVERKGKVAVGAAIFLVILIPTLYQIYWKQNTPVDFYYPGFLISDQNTYTAIFRSVFDRGNGITYSYPYSAPGADNPPVFFQLPFTLLAWLWKVTGNLLATWEIFRYAFGLGFLWMLYVLVSGLFESFYPDDMKERAAHSLLNTLFIILIFGAGLAWFIAAFRYGVTRLAGTPPPHAGFLESFIDVESNYAGWILNIFRNTFNPLEGIYHFFFFMAVVGVISEKRTLIIAGQVLTCLSGVFAGIEISAILICFFALEYLYTRQGRRLSQLVTSVLVFALFILYYKIFMEWFPISRNLVHQHLINIHGIIPLRCYFPAYGILLFSAPISLLDKKFRNMFFYRREGRLLFAWLIVVVCLSQNDKILAMQKSIQPAHFLRGYLYTVLFLISSLRFFPNLIRIARHNSLKVKIILAGLFLLMIPDNFLNLKMLWIYEPHPYFLIIPRDSKAVLDFLNTLPSQENILCSDIRLGDQIPAFTHHSSVIAMYYATPFDDDKKRMSENFYENVDVEEFLQKYRITSFIIPNGTKIPLDEKIERAEWKVLYENDTWKVYQIPH